MNQEMQSSKARNYNKKWEFFSKIEKTFVLVTEHWKLHIKKKGKISFKNFVARFMIDFEFLIEFANLLKLVSVSVLKFFAATPKLMPHL